MGIWLSREYALNFCSSVAPSCTRFLVRGKPTQLLHTPVRPLCDLSMKSPR
ncbi:MAG: hypothetical protein AVDCRST_MAG89-1988 [uncultured Gemmatimonadetes bacterium]|uniref:Uncharacterized protein n=1 Tax=uncultured Gemmatimonadota bacterium TaxID=203437 RepID=A0A6J4LA17_9BACT|nr:MAG: hypothetical protein AVDCRST_MAG89-1988 [uncultured Gemmatimonadota bacterium]